MGETDDIKDNYLDVYLDCRVWMDAQFYIAIWNIDLDNHQQGLSHLHPRLQLKRLQELQEVEFLLLIPGMPVEQESNQEPLEEMLFLSSFCFRYLLLNVFSID